MAAVAGIRRNMNYKKAFIFTWLIISVIIGASVSYASQCGDNSCTLPDITAQKVNGTVFYDQDNLSYYIDPASEAISALFAGTLQVKNDITITYPGNVNSSKYFGVNGHAPPHIGGTAPWGGMEVETLQDIPSGSHDTQLYFITSDSGVVGGARRVTIDKNGNVAIGATAFPSGGGTPVYVMGQANGAPTGFGSNTGGMVVLDTGGTAEVYLCDEAANCAIQTPHANDFLNNLSLDYYYPWVYESSNPYIGRKITVDMEGVIRAIESLTGKQFIFTENITKLSWTELENWRESEENNKNRDAEAVAWLRNNSEIEVSASQAFETQPSEKIIQTGKIIGSRTVYNLDELNGTVTPVQVPIYETKKIIQTKKKLKDNVRFDRSIGKFYQTRTKKEALAAVGENYPHYIRQAPPKWMAVRGVN